MTMRLIVTAAVLLVGGCSGPPPNPRSFEKLSEDPVVHGERLSRVLGCTGCHGRALTGSDWSDELGRLWTANLTRSAERHKDSAVIGMIVSGRQAETGRSLLGMPSYLFTHLDRKELKAVVAYIRSRPVSGVAHPPPTYSAKLREMMARGEGQNSVQEVVGKGGEPGPVAGPGHARARYIVRATCAECHGIDLAGGEPPGGGTPRPDIRMVAAAYSPDDFERLLTTGVAAGGRRTGLMGEVARGRYAFLTAAERRAIHSYLLALNERSSP